jgi:RimJ/RimL family protein N-acetyltransferase
MLQGNGFILRGWKKGDEISLQRNADNPNVARFLTDRFPSPYTKASAIYWVDSQLYQNPLTNFAIVIDNEVVGGIGLEFREDIYRKTALLGYWLSEYLWGRGIMPEAVRLITDYAFKDLDILRIQAGVLSKNPSSIRVLEKAGYTKEGILKNSVIKNNEIMDEHLYAICKKV